MGWQFLLGLLRGFGRLVVLVWSCVSLDEFGVPNLGALSLFTSFIVWFVICK
eukprot:gene3063-2045_t